MNLPRALLSNRGPEISQINYGKNRDQRDQRGVNFQAWLSFAQDEPKICKKCNEIAKLAESSQFRVLPGVLNSI